MTTYKISGSRESSGGGAGGKHSDDAKLTLRIHRGRPTSATATSQKTALSVHSTMSSISVASNLDQHPDLHGNAPLIMQKRATSMKMFTAPKSHEKIAMKVSFPSSDDVLNQECSSPSYTSVTHNGKAATHFKTSLLEIGETTFNTDSSQQPQPESTSQKCQKPKKTTKFQVRRFRVETKAAKTLAIIVGGFIFCWLPFFTMYVVRSFCEQCIQPLMFSVLFWLGYCNSAINPLIYALFSNEFRIAFKRILFRCVCTRSGFRASENFQMMAARTLLAPAHFHKTISGCSEENADDDSWC